MLLKSILQAIRIYPLLAMAVPKEVCTKMMEIFRKFIWGGPKHQKKWAPISWKGVIKHKEEWGLGLRDPSTLNQVLGAKLWWRRMRSGEDLWKKIWTQKYNMLTTVEVILIFQGDPQYGTCPVKIEIL